MDYILHPIGVVRSPYKKREDAPRQGRLSDNISEIIIETRYMTGLFRLEEIKYIFVLCWFDKADRTRLKVTPPHQTTERGVFSSRSPDRPNPISLSLVELIEVTIEGILKVRGLDALDGTPVLDIKIYSEEIDNISGPDSIVIS